MPHPTKGRKAPRGKVISGAEFARLWLDRTVTVKQIGDLLGISSEAVCSRANTRGLPGRTDAGIIIRKKKINDEEFAALYQARVRTADLCAKYGVTHPRIGRTADRLKIPRRNLYDGNGSITLAEYEAMKLRAAMAATAKVERGHWKNAEMVDGSARTGRWAA